MVYLNCGAASLLFLEAFPRGTFCFLANEPSGPLPVLLTVRPISQSRIARSAGQGIFRYCKMHKKLDKSSQARYPHIPHCEAPMRYVRFTSVGRALRLRRLDSHSATDKKIRILAGIDGWRAFQTPASGGNSRAPTPWWRRGNPALGCLGTGSAPRRPALRAPRADTARAVIATRVRFIFLPLNKGRCGRLHGRRLSAACLDRRVDRGSGRDKSPDESQRRCRRGLVPSG